MRYHIDTIPLWDAMNTPGECPLCQLRRQTESKLVERCLGAAVMSSEERSRVNQSGFCRRHQQMLYANAQGNRLGHALMMLSHLQTLLPKADKALAAAVAQANGKPEMIRRFSKSSSAPRKGDKAGEGLAALASRCVLCEELDAQNDRQAEGFLHLWKSDLHFRDSFRQSGGLCIPDAVQALLLAQNALAYEKMKTFAEDIRHTLIGSLSVLEKDLDWYTKKFDYRNAAKPWGTARDALERTVNRLRGWCLGNDTI